MVEEKKIIELGTYCIKNHIEISDLVQIAEKRVLENGTELKKYLERMAESKDFVYKANSFFIDNKNNLIMDNENHNLSFKCPEILICRFLMVNPDAIIPNEYIQKMLTIHGYLAKPESITAYISNLNKKLSHTTKKQEHLILSRRNKGYQWNKNIKIMSELRL